MFKHRQRVNAAFAKGLMFGKTVGARDERDRIIALLEGKDVIGVKVIIKMIKGKTNE